jgi:hypothetical protein
MTTETKQPCLFIWSYCPECGNNEYNKGIWTKGNEEHICTNCKQSWFGDIDYSDCIIEKLKKLKAKDTILKAALEALAISKKYHNIAHDWHAPEECEIDVPESWKDATNQDKEDDNYGWVTYYGLDEKLKQVITQIEGALNE